MEALKKACQEFEFHNVWTHGGKSWTKMLMTTKSKHVMIRRL